MHYSGYCRQWLINCVRRLFCFIFFSLRTNKNGISCRAHGSFRLFVRTLRVWPLGGKKRSAESVLAAGANVWSRCQRLMFVCSAGDGGIDVDDAAAKIPTLFSFCFHPGGCQFSTRFLAARALSRSAGKTFHVFFIHWACRFVVAAHFSFRVHSDAPVSRRLGRS